MKDLVVNKPFISYSFWSNFILAMNRPLLSKSESVVQNDKLINHTPHKKNYFMTQEKLLIMLSRSCIHIDFVERLFGLIVKVHSTNKPLSSIFLLTRAADNGTDFACQSPWISFTLISFHPAANGDTNQVEAFERRKFFNKIHKRTHRSINKKPVP